MLAIDAYPATHESVTSPVEPLQDTVSTKHILYLLNFFKAPFSKNLVNKEYVFTSPFKKASASAIEKDYVVVRGYPLSPKTLESYDGSSSSPDSDVHSFSDDSECK